MAHYFIFKKDNLTGKTVHVCNGSHDTDQEVLIHWRSYMYGFYDGAVELLGSGNFQFMEGSHKYSFLLNIDGQKNVEYFCLTDREEAYKLIMEISNNE